MAHIPGKNNIVADRESRQHLREIEWTLNQELYEEGICKLSVKPDIDMFASRLNCILKPYVSYKPDPGAVAVDAVNVQWSRYNNGNFICVFECTIVNLATYRQFTNAA